MYALIPALDEAANVERLFADLRDVRTSLAAHDMTLRVVLIDDGSTDGTASAARAAAGTIELSVERHERRCGPGRAFATGFEAIAPVLRDEDFVLTLEADNTSRLDVLELMLLRSREGHDAVFASPYAYGGGVIGTTLLRTGLSHIANSFVKGCLGIRGLLTVSSFYRLYRGSTIRRLQSRFGVGLVERRGFESMVELALKLVYSRMSISEVPMVLDAGRRVGSSKMRVTRTGVGYLAMLRLKSRWRAAAVARAPDDALPEAGLARPPAAAATSDLASVR